MSLATTKVFDMENRKINYYRWDILEGLWVYKGSTVRFKRLKDAAQRVPDPRNVARQLTEWSKIEGLWCVGYEGSNRLFDCAHLVSDQGTKRYNTGLKGRKRA